MSAGAETHRRQREENDDMKLAVIGSGSVGSAIARAAKSTGHEVVVADAAAASLKALGDALGVETTQANVDAVKDADAVALAVPFGALETITSEISDQAAGKIVIDATNPLKEDSSGLATEGASGAELVQQQLPQAKVVKAFNTVLAANQDKGEIDGTQLDGFVAGDDPDAKKQVAGLLKEIGYRPIDVGPLAMARYLEAMAFLNITLNASKGWSWQTGWKLVGPTD
jgi:predicted dinucleotide-binding enzyme